MDLFTERADDKSVAYLISVVGLLTDWLMDLSLKVVPVIHILRAEDETFANEVSEDFIRTATATNSFLQRMKEDTGDCVIYLNEMAIEFVKYNEPHNLVQSQVFGRALEMNTRLPELVASVVTVIEKATGQEAPSDFITNMKEDVRILLDKAVTIG